MHECRKCERFGLTFQRDYPPAAFLEGSPDSKVWVIGLNPAVTPAPEISALSGYFANPLKMHSYFKKFRTVSSRLFSGFGKVGGTAHTDLVKCASKSWPPENVSARASVTIIRNCEGYLRDQIQKFRPAMIVCNGSDVSVAIRTALPPSSPVSEEATSYISKVGDQVICVVLSGFIGRIDNYAKRRLGREIEERLHELGV